MVQKVRVMVIFPHRFSSYYCLLRHRVDDMLQELLSGMEMEEKKKKLRGLWNSKGLNLFYGSFFASFSFVSMTYFTRNGQTIVASLLISANFPNASIFLQDIPSE